MSKMLIITAPSGAGKTTIVRHLLKTFPELSFSVSATTRAKRPHEVDGVDYHFITKNDFVNKMHNSEFAEWEEVYPNMFYGTLHHEIDRVWQADKHIIFDIEVKGATNLKRAYPDRSLVVFVKPPDEETLFRRLRERNTEDATSLTKRIARMAEELTYEDKFDCVLVNDDLATALAEAEQITRDFLHPQATD
jgi:guanylate kinase